jgi:glycine cleavage system H protein
MGPEEARYSEDHQWVTLGEHGAEVGITDYAQGELGDLTFVELPEVGKEVSQHEEIAVVESTKAASDVYAPISGRIVAVNTTLEDSPETINRDPYGDGWICRIKHYDEDEFNQLMDGEAYEEFISKK